MVDAWWESFFEGVAVDLWMALGNVEQDRAEVDYIEQALRLPPGGKVLDVPCGHGRHALELAARGFEVTGVDISSEFLSCARRRAADRELQVRWEQRDMRNLPWEGEFDGALCFGNSFGYLDRPGNAEFIKAVARALKPGGRFVLDSSMIAESILPNFQHRRWFEAGDILMLVENRYEHAAGRMVTDYTFVRDGQVEKRASAQQVYTYRELCSLLHEAGFAEVEGYSSLDREPYGLGAQRLLLESTRR